MGSFGSIFEMHQDRQVSPAYLQRTRTYSSPYTFCLLTKSNQVSPTSYIIHPLPPVLPPRNNMTLPRPIVPITLAKSIHMLEDPVKPLTVLSILQEDTRM